MLTTEASARVAVALEHAATHLAHIGASEPLDDTARLFAIGVAKRVRSALLATVRLYRSDLPLDCYGVARVAIEGALLARWVARGTTDAERTNRAQKLVVRQVYDFDVHLARLDDVHGWNAPEPAIAAHKTMVSQVREEWGSTKEFDPGSLYEMAREERSDDLWLYNTGFQPFSRFAHCDPLIIALLGAGRPGAKNGSAGLAGALLGATRVMDACGALLGMQDYCAPVVTFLDRLASEVLPNVDHEFRDPTK